MGHRLLPNNPHVYHGLDHSRPYFEGWYFKQVSKEHTFSVIPGVFRGKTEDDDIAFIQLIFGTAKSYFIRYPYNKFKCNPHQMKIWIGDSFFSMDMVILDIDQDDIRLEAELFFSRIVPLKTSIISPSIMGPFSYLPGMQCNHGVLSLTHRVNGAINYGDEHIHFNDADGYIEKDWGEAFPKSWIWMQSNDDKTSLMCAIALIPYGVIHFTGLICVLLVDNKQYRFATYNGARVLSITKRDDKMSVTIVRKGYRLCINAENKIFGKLKAPTKNGMNREIDESVSATYHILLFYKDKEVYSGRYENGGLEMLYPEMLIKEKI